MLEFSLKGRGQTLRLECPVYSNAVAYNLSHTWVTYMSRSSEVLLWRFACFDMKFSRVIVSI